MIRINLLPQSKRGAVSASGGSGQVWGVAYLVAVGLTIICLAGVYFLKDGELTEQLAQNATLTREIADLRSRSARLEEVRASLERSQRLDAVVGDLNRARSGPLRIVMELSHVLSENVGPTIDPARLERLRQENPLAGFNPAWDVRRLWLMRFDENARVVTVKGRARTNDDVAEFLRRISLSEMFSEVTLTKTQSTVAAGGLEIIDFELTCKVTY